MSENVKKSNFVETHDVNDDATFDFVENGTNKKIPMSDLVTKFGVTGSLEQAGEAAAVPVLQKVGTTNKIRNIQGNKGIGVSLSPENGILLGHNFTVDSTGVPIMLNKTADAPDLVSLIAGAGMNVVASGNTVQFTATGITVAANVVVVNQMSDFPTAIGGVITLIANTAYLVSANLSTSDRFVLGDNTLVYGPGREVSSLTYTGSGVMFTATNVGAKLEKLSISCASGTLFDISGTGVESFRMVDCSVSSVSKIGDVDGVLFFGMSVVAFSSITTNGIIFKGNITLASIDKCSFLISGGTVFDFGTSLFSLSFTCLSSLAILGAGTFFLDGAASSANFSAGVLATVSFGAFIGSGTTLATNITISDNRWYFMGNNSIPDTKSGALMQMSSNATNTVIAVAGTPVLVAGTWVEKKAVRFTTDAAGKITYTAERPLSSPITITATGAPVSGTNKTISYHLYVNGADVGADQLNIISSGSPKNTTLLWGHAFAEGDYVELYVSNDTDTIDVLVQSAVFRVS